MFNDEFYPTPRAVIERMFAGLDVSGSVVLDPQAGSGKLIEFANEVGAHTLACEINDDLAKIASQKANEFIGRDFFDIKAEDVSHVDFIIMNPPFSNADKHMIHACEVAPDGCTIISLCNWETISNTYTRDRKQLYKLIHDNGTKENLGNVFSTADRKTDVEIGMVSMFKPKTGDDEFADYLFSDDEEPEYHASGLIQYSYIRDIVGRYVQGCKLYESVIESSKAINEVIKPLGGSFTINFRAIEECDSSHIDYDQYKKSLQKSAWRGIFKKLDMGKYLTTSTLADVNRFVEQQTNKPFSMKNVEAMLSVIVGTHGSRMNKVIEETFDWLTDRHDGNRKEVEGWKTNSMYMVNKKFIAPYSNIGFGSYGQPEIRWSTTGHKIDDLVKSICYITGKNYDNYESIEDFFRTKQVKNEDYFNAIAEVSEVTGLPNKSCTFWHSQFKYFNGGDRDKLHGSLRMQWTRAYNENDVNTLLDFYEAKKYPKSVFDKENPEYKEWGKWQEWTWFKIKVYKKGTFHVQFLDDKIWEMFNKAAVKAKGWQLPTQTGSDVRRKKTGVEVFQ